MPRSTSIFGIANAGSHERVSSFMPTTAATRNVRATRAMSPSLSRIMESTLRQNGPDRRAPGAQAALAVRAGHLRGPALRDLARRPARVLPAERARREQPGAERGRLDQRGARDLDAEEVGLHLHQEIVRGRAAVDAQLARTRGAVVDHGVEQVARLPGDGLEHRA